MIKRNGTFFLIICNFIFFSTYAQQKITLQQAIDSTLKNNLDVQKAGLIETGSALDVYKAKMSIYPNLNANLGSNIEFGRNLDPTNYYYVDKTTISSSDNLVSNVTLFQGFEKLNQIKQNKFILESNKSSLQKIKNSLTLQVVSTYLNLLKFKDQLSAAIQQNEFAKQQLANESKNFEKGKKMLADVSRAKFQLSRTDVDISNIKNQINSSSVDLLQLMNLNPALNFDTEEPVLNSTENLKRSVVEVYNYASKTLPEFKQAEYSRQAAEMQVEVARGGYYPSLTLSGAVASAYSKQLNSPVSFFGPPKPLFNQLHTNLYEYFSLNLSIPIFNNFGNKINVSKAKIALNEASINDQQVSNAIYKVISQAMGDLEAASENYISSQSACESAKETFRVVSKRYKSGLSSSLDFTQALNDMNSTEFTLIHDKYDFIFKSKVIDFYLGKPILY